ncbi:MAG TPA: agmatinase [bacterium]|nr:agmatinase [bacterium]HNS48223.1 agmatinase [bacterium]
MEIPYTFAGWPPRRLEEARAAILPVAYDATTSYRSGTRFGPQEIILASRFLEMYDEALGLEPGGPGVVTLPELWPDLASPEAALREVQAYVDGLLEKNLFPVVLGGEHSITYGAVQAVRKFHPGLSVLVLDAHADLRQDYQGTRYNHACVSRRILDLGVPVTVLGVRSLPSEDLPLLESGKEPGLNLAWASQLKAEPDWLGRFGDRLTETVYLSIDLDFFDPAYVPAVGTPEPGGLGWDETAAFLAGLAGRRRLVGFDVVELDGSVHHTPSAYLAARLVHRLLGLCLPAADRY